MNMERAYKAIKSNPLLKAGIQIKADLMESCPIFSQMPPELERLPPPEVIGSIVILL